MTASLLEATRSAAQPGRRGQLTELFYERFFYNDLISSHDDPQLASANLMAMLAFPGMLCLYWIPKYYVSLVRASQAERDLAVLGDRFLWLTFEMAVLGLLATLQWDRLFPGPRDFMILGPQPVSPRVLFEAQAIALGRFLGLFFVIANLVSAVFFPIAATPRAAGAIEGLAFALGHWASIVAAALFAVLLVVALQGLLTILLTPRLFERVSPIAQSLLSAFFLGVIVLLPLLRARAFAGIESVSAIADPGNTCRVLPPMLFAALGEKLAGRGESGLTPVAWSAVSALAGITLIAAGTYILSYQRFLRRSLESARQSVKRDGWVRRFVRTVWPGAIVKDPSERAAFLFTLWTLGRSRQHRLYIGAFIAVAAAVIVARTWPLPSLAAPSSLLLEQAYVFLFLALVGLRVVFAMPAELAANWTFRFHASTRSEPYARGTRKAVWTAVVIPLTLATAASFAVLWSLPGAGTHAAVMVMISWMSVELVLFGFWKIPFTCSYVAGRAHVIILWTFCAVGMLVYSMAMASLEAWTLESGWRLLVLAAFAAAAATVWPRYRSTLAARAGGPIFDEPEDTRIFLLKIGE